MSTSNTPADRISARFQADRLLRVRAQICFIADDETTRL